MKKKLLLLPVIVALLAFGAFALLYRPAKGTEIDRRMEAQVDTWQQAQATRPTEITGEEKGPYPELKAAMEEYNQAIYENGQEALKDSHSYTEELLDLESYGITDGIVGVISVPSVGVSMPLFLGASTDNLAKGFAQLSYTSMPIGGENTACVAAAHREILPGCRGRANRGHRGAAKPLGNADLPGHGDPGDRPGRFRSHPHPGGP